MVCSKQPIGMDAYLQMYLVDAVQHCHVRILCRSRMSFRPSMSSVSAPQSTKRRRLPLHASSLQMQTVSNHRSICKAPVSPSMTAIRCDSMALVLSCLAAFDLMAYCVHASQGLALVADTKVLIQLLVLCRSGTVDSSRYHIHLTSQICDHRLRKCCQLLRARAHQRTKRLLPLWQCCSAATTMTTAAMAAVPAVAAQAQMPMACLVPNQSAAGRKLRLPPALQAISILMK